MLSLTLHHVLPSDSLHWKRRADTDIKLIMNCVHHFYESSVETKVSKTGFMPLLTLHLPGEKTF